LGSLWYSSRRKSKREILNASNIQELGGDLDLDANEEDLSFISSDGAERSEGVGSSSDNSDMILTRLPNSFQNRKTLTRVRNEWVSIQITPKQKS
jgi:anionic cell wall polymer biosynthesis LytR-Cps2A-Psr (LCP) family protein